jgi:hypothetical protein
MANRIGMIIVEEINGKAIRTLKPIINTQLTE